MKLEGTISDLPIYSDPSCPEGYVFVINDNFKINYPLRKDGKPDMRYSINKLEAAFRQIYFK